MKALVLVAALGAASAAAERSQLGLRARASDCPNDCSGHGECNADFEGDVKSFFCSCEAGYVGDDCSQDPCELLEQCSGHGECLSPRDDSDLLVARCDCEEGWTGDKCHLLDCPVECVNGTCYNGTCRCEAGFVGEDCSQPACGPGHACNNHGECVKDVCRCERGWEGDFCDEVVQLCPGDCNDHGLCVNGSCVCDAGWEGFDCSNSTCPDNCNVKKGHGRCVDYTCNCKAGWMGKACHVPACPNKCSGHGECDVGTCVCENGWTGDDCGTTTCPEDCGRGECSDDGTGLRCHCEPGFLLPDCTTCNGTFHCFGHGECGVEDPKDFDETPTCVCRPGWVGEFCEKSACPSNSTDMFVTCSGHGNCVNETETDFACSCDNGWTGNDCNTPKCPNGCVHGECEITEAGTRECQCYPGWMREACDVRTCPIDDEGRMCHGNGICHEGTCYCAGNFLPPDCSHKACPNDCSGHGICQREGKCDCDNGWEGEDCGDQQNCTEQCNPKPKHCPNDCSGHGVCDNAKCTCTKGWKGADCSIMQCPQNCSGNGVCVKGKCECDPLFAGEACTIKLCPKDCSGHGTCRNGVCDCERGWWSDSCSLRGCEQNCHGHGYCLDGVCNCRPGWTGDYCQLKSCPNDCSGHGICRNGTCDCELDFSGIDCSHVPCPRGKNDIECSGRGMCHSGTCECVGNHDAPYDHVFLFTGKACEKRQCPVKDCNGHGRCNPKSGKCECDKGYHGLGCGGRQCPENCNGHGSCSDDFKCVCERGYSGRTCAKASCKYDPVKKEELPGCGDNGVCVNGMCYCHPAYTGRFCRDRKPVVNQNLCKNNCTGRGTCVEDPVKHVHRCLCVDGYDGDDCSKPSCGDGEEGCDAKVAAAKEEAREEATEQISEQLAEQKPVDGSPEPEASAEEEQEPQATGGSASGATGAPEPKQSEPKQSKSHASTKTPTPGRVTSDPANQCPNDCSGNGKCVEGVVCQCAENFFGEDCSCTKQCPVYHVCQRGDCVCAPGRTGENCDKREEGPSVANSDGEMIDDPNQVVDELNTARFASRRMESACSRSCSKRCSMFHSAQPEQLNSCVQSCESMCDA